MKKLLVLLLLLAGAGALWAYKARVTEEVQVTVESYFRATQITRYGPNYSGVMVVLTDKGEFAFPESRAAHALASGQKHHWQISRPLLGEEMPLVEGTVGADGAITPIKPPK